MRLFELSGVVLAGVVIHTVLPAATEPVRTPDPMQAAKPVQVDKAREAGAVLLIKPELLTPKSAP